MRRRTVRSGLKMILLGVLSVMAVTFFHAELSLLFLLDWAGEAQLTFFGFLIGGMLAGVGVIVTAFGLLQSGSNESGIRLAPLILFVIIAILLFFFLAYSSLFHPSTPRLTPGETISI